MASVISQQLAYRAQKSLGLIGGLPNYEPVEGFIPPEETARTCQYSQDGKLWACALPSGIKVYDTQTFALALEIPVPNIVELAISPKSNFISTWERPVKLEDGSQHKNLRIWSIATGEELVAFTQKSQDGWDVQYTASESHALRLVGPDIQVFTPSDWSVGIVEKLKVEGCTAFSLSPGANPSVAVFVPEKKGAPASVKVYNLSTLSATPSCQKNFFKADRVQFKWNSTGTQVLLLTHTDVDKSNKSYYGETGLYMLSASGNFDCRVTLDKEGPIHDFTWNPNAKEFGVVYGYMPAKTVLFDQRVRILHDYGSAPHNFISFNPQGRLVILAGFGNLAGKIDVHDRRTLTKVTTIEAPNTSVCEWSPDGQFILTATLSPRLRVDNGIKIWHCSSSTLIHHLAVEEMYQAGWRPVPLSNVPPFPQGIPQTPPPSASAVAALADGKTATPSKPTGAYRPPGARGLATPSIFKREDEGGLAHVQSNGHGSPTPQRGYSPRTVPGAPSPNHDQRNGHQRGPRQRHVPGAPSPSQTPVPNGNGDGHGKPKNKKGRKGAKENGGGSGTATPVEGIEIVPVEVVAPEPVSAVSPVIDEQALDSKAKKIRNLTKKLKAIEELKEKAQRGERLEITQVRKIEGEDDIRKELSSLGASS